MSEKTAIGVMGCGNISSAYFHRCKTFPYLDLAACADLDSAKAAAAAESFAIPRVCSPDELLDDPEIDLILNLTTPQAHTEVALAALEAGKAVYNEKPLAVTREDAELILDISKRCGKRVGCAPDTVLGAGIQTARKLIDDGWIGEPVAATAFMVCRGHESWHPSPAFYYQTGGGPMFDMGPYYLSALVTLLGPVTRVTGSAQTSFPERLITSQPLAGQRIPVEVPTHVTGTLDFACGAVATIITSFDIWAAHLPPIEIHGSDGSLSVPDPNTFGGPVAVLRPPDRQWHEVPLTHPYSENSRGLGVADMACAMRSGRDHRASAELGFHVLEIMHAIHDASREGRHIELKSSCPQPEPMPMDLAEGGLIE
jgi:predicted dehydrogenase